VGNIVLTDNALRLRPLASSRRPQQNYSQSLEIDVGAILQPFRCRGFVVNFFCEKSSRQKPGLQSSPIGFLGVVEQTEMLGDGIGGQTAQIGSRQTHERFRFGAGHGDL
jgi:hypothetical protein